MAIEDQRDVIAFLSTPAAFARRTDPIERIDTHISIVWLAGDQVYKLKRAVRFDYVDFSTIELRRQACEAEVRLNRRTAPSLYRGVQCVTREADGSLAVGGAGVPVDWVVDMARFDQETLFDRLAERDRLDASLMEGLAETIVRLHAAAERRPDRGGREGMAWVIEGNARGFDEQGGTVLDGGERERLTAGCRSVLDRQATLLEARRRRGLVRWCHGDLHLRNICLIDGVPTLFDAVEFNENISCIDVLYDLAFLVMDLWHRDLRAHANIVFNEYFGRLFDLEGLPLLPLFLACRAAVRAKTSVTAAGVQSDRAEKRRLERAACEYLELAQALLRPAPASLVAIGGFSGSGKSTLAQRLGPGVGSAPGALILRSDMIRKRLMGVPPRTRLGPDGYAPAVTRRVYQTIAEHAKAAIRAGHAAIVDAVYASADERDGIASIARDAGVPFVGLWLEGPQQLLARRLQSRTGDVSDATADVLDRQLESGAGSIDWPRLDGTLDPDRVQALAEERLPR
jgi:uncharacterized protein